MNQNVIKVLSIILMIAVMVTVSIITVINYDTVTVRKQCVQAINYHCAQKSEIFGVPKIQEIFEDQDQKEVVLFAVFGNDSDRLEGLETS